MESRRQNVSEDGRTISPRVTQSISFLDGREKYSLPFDLMIEIFSRMTSKSIASSRCVSRLWESILRRQDFTESFLAKSCARPQILFACEDYFKTKGDSELLFFSSPQPQNPDKSSLRNPDKNLSVEASKYHLAQLPSNYDFFDRTDGFFCYGAEEVINGRRNHLFVSVIYNPTTGQSLILPKLKSTRRTADSFLGYDPIAKEFKLLSMTYSPSDNEKISEEHQVLTLGTNNMSWRMVKCCIPRHSASRIWICISGVLYYIASPKRSSVNSMVVRFDLRSEKFSVVEFMETSNSALPDFATPIDYNGKLGLLFSPGSRYVRTSFELWVLDDAGKHQWSKYIYVLPPEWRGSVPDIMCITGMVGTSDIVFSPYFEYVPSYVIYYNVKRKTITKVGIKGMDACGGKRFYTFLNYVENVKLI